MIDIWIGGLFAFVLGACFGSFANVLIYRLHDHSAITGRSHCPECKTTIKPRHLVPILSWILLRARCASCGKRIHFQYPAVEAGMGVLFLIAFLRHPTVLVGQDFSAFAFETVFSFVLLGLVVFDLRWKLLPVEIMAGSAAVFALWSFLAGMPLWSLAAGVAFGVSFLLIQVLLSRGKWMGSGDPWLGGLIGAALGWPLVGVSFYLTYLIGGAVALFLLTSGLAKRSARVPFAPMLAGGALLAVWFGAPILSAAARLFS